MRLMAIAPDFVKRIHADVNADANADTNGVMLMLMVMLTMNLLKIPSLFYC
jgi:hypothetical protein